MAGNRLIAALLRHGEFTQPTGVPSAHLPQGLTESGRLQCRAAGPGLLEVAHGFEATLHPEIDCSPLRRAWETATLVAQGLSEDMGCTGSFRVQEAAALAERSVGSMANLSVEAIEAFVRDDPRYPDLPEGWKRQPEFALPFPGAESLMDAGRRVAAHLEAQMSPLAERSEGSRLKIFVGHGGAFRHAAAHLDLLPYQELAAWSMWHVSPVFIERLGPGQWRRVGGAWKARNNNGKNPSEEAIE